MHNYISFSDADIAMQEAYRNEVEWVSWSKGMGGVVVAAVVDYDDEWGLENVPSSKDADVLAILRFDFLASNGRCSKLGITVYDLTGDVVGLALQSVEALKTADETKAQIRELEASRVEQSAKVPVSKDYGSATANENRRPVQLVAVLSVDTGCGKDW